MLKGLVQVTLSDGRVMALEDLVKDYERLLNEKNSPKAVTQSKVNKETSRKTITSKLKVGKWFRIDRDVIDKSKEEIRRKCIEAGAKGKELWKRFEKSNKIADDNPDQYSRLIETYIFKYNWAYKTGQQMLDMCEDVGDGMCCEVICDLELQMRICNGESVNALTEKADKLPHKRVIKLRNGGTGYFGGGAGDNDDYPPAYIRKSNFSPVFKYCGCTPYGFRRVLS